MPAVLRRPRVLVLAGVLVVAAVAFAVALVRSQTPGCDVPPPDLNLPSQLKAVGDLAQPLDVGDTRSLQDASVRAATALHSDLAGARADDPVRLQPDGGARYQAVVVPLSVAGSSADAPRRVVGLVGFLLDCGGRGYYDDVDDLLRTDPSLLPAHFPTVAGDEAAATLGSTRLRLVYRDTPFHALWLDPGSGRTVAAGPPV